MLRYKVLHIQYVHLSLAFASGATAINSPSWEAFLLTMVFDFGNFFWKVVKWKSLNTTEQKRGWFMEKVGLPLGDRSDAWRPLYPSTRPRLGV